MNKIILFLTLLISTVAFAQEDDIEVINIECPALQAYMADNTYLRDSSFNTTVVMQYVDKVKYGNHYDPNGKQVSWNPTASPEDITSICIYVSTSKDYHDGFTEYPTSKKSSSYNIRNLLPNKVYYYKVEQTTTDGKVTILTHGTFRTTGQVRFIHATGGYNIRDIGGWPTTLVPGGRLKYGILFRGANLDKVKQDGIHDLVDNLHIGAELDLRSESKLTSSALGSRVHFAKLVTDSYSLSGQASKYVRDLKWIISELRQGRNVYWHCAVGCDRCGTLSFLIEGVLGVDEINLCRDYELSCFRNFKRMRSHVGFRRLIPWMKANYPRATLAQSFYDYWIHYGMTPEELNYLRQVMVGSGSSEVQEGKHSKFEEYMYHDD